MTGQSTRPPTTLGNAPSIPATTTRRIGALQVGKLVQAAGASRPRPTSATSETSQFQASAVTRASSATGKSLVPAVTITTRPSFGPLSRGPSGRETFGPAHCAHLGGRPS